MIKRNYKPALRPPPPYAEAARRLAGLGAAAGVIEVILAQKASSAVLEEAVLTLAVFCNVAPVDELTEPMLRLQIVPAMRQHMLRAGVQKARGVLALSSAHVVARARRRTSACNCARSRRFAGDVSPPGRARVQHRPLRRCAGDPV